MNDLMNLTTTTMTMSSLEIAEVTGKYHKNVLRDIEKMVEELGSTLSSQLESTTYVDSNNIQRKKYVLDKELTITLTAGYSVTQRHAIIKRWLELEGQQQAPMTQTEILVAQAQRLLDFEREQRVLSEKTAEISSRLDQIETAGTHFTIMGWSSLNGRQVTLPMASSMGKKATRHCKTHGIQTGSVPDPRFGRANTYPKDVLDYLFAD